MEDLKAILTVGAILVVPFIAAPKAMFAIVLYIRGEKRCVSKFGRSENI